MDKVTAKNHGSKAKVALENAADPVTPLRYSGEALAFKIRHDAMRKKGASLLHSASALVGSSVRRLSSMSSSGSSRKASSSCTMDLNPGSTELYCKGSNESFGTSPVRMRARILIVTLTLYPLLLSAPLPFCVCLYPSLCLNL